MQPEDVTSPSNRLKNPQIIYNAGDWAVAEFLWDGEPAIGIRWNGRGLSNGFPLSHGEAAWFVLPDDFLTDFVRLYARLLSERAAAQPQSK